MRSLSVRLYWVPTDAEFATTNGWPSGWQTPNTQINAVIARLPYTDIPSTDGKWYYDQPFDVVSTGLKTAGYQNISVNDQRNQKNVSSFPLLCKGQRCRDGPCLPLLTQRPSYSIVRLWSS